MIWVAALMLFQIQALDLPNVETNPHTTAADVAIGKRMYAGRCAGCHGPVGDGGKGTNLATSLLPRAQTDIALYRIIRYGLPDTEMPSHNLTQREVWQLSAYVRTLGRVDGEQVRGDPARGATLVRGTGGCLQCHIVNGEGGHTGPALTDIGRRRSPSYLRMKLTEPEKDISGFSLVQLTTRAGQKLSGIRMNEDTWSIQMRDMSNRLHSFWKQDLTRLDIEERTLMPSYAKRMDTQQLNDVVSYLLSLRSEP